MKEQIINFLKSNDHKKYTIHQLAELMDIEDSKSFIEFVKIIANLEENKIIDIDNDGLVQIKQQKELLSNVLLGTYRANERGFGFVSIEELDKDIFIASNHVNNALDGDFVEVKLLKTANELTNQLAEGKIIEIKDRAFDELTVIIEEVFYDEKKPDIIGIARATNNKLKKFPVYINNLGLTPKKDEVCRISIQHYPTKKHINIVGSVINILGHRDDPGVDILTIVENHGIEIEFPQDVLDEANNIPEEITTIDDNRHDLRDRQIITIDGETAKDLDDAVEVEKLDNGNYLLGVHIADVSYYVTDKSALDKEAFERGTSVYLTDRVIPMLPRKLSNGICSLNPKVNRYTISCYLEINLNGEVENYRLFPSVICSSERMTYTNANKLLLDEQSEELQKYDYLIPMLKKMEELHHILSKMRERRGAISFEDRESIIKLDDEGKPIDIEVRVRGVAEKMIESFMLIANETVAKHFNSKHLPFIYRIHETPKEDKIKTFAELISTLGFNGKLSVEKIESKDLQNILNYFENHAEETMVNKMLLRSMQQAKYSDDPVGHFGLAATDYTHFTSPIRRYPDLIVHRLIREQYNNLLTTKRQQNWAKRLPEIAEHSSQMERRAIDAERETDALKKAEYMTQHINEVYDGVISSITKFGVFVELSNTIEGLIHLSKIKTDYYQYNEKHMMLVGKRTGHVLKLGDKIKIKVVRADVETREIDFELYTNDSENVNNQKAKVEDYTKTNKKDKKQKRKNKKRTKKPFYKGIVKKNRRKRKG